MDLLDEASTTSSRTSIRQRRVGCASHIFGHMTNSVLAKNQLVAITISTLFPAPGALEMPRSSKGPGREIIHFPINIFNKSALKLAFTGLIYLSIHK